MDPIPVNQKSDTTYRPFHGDAFHNPTGEPQGHLKGASATSWSTQWYSCVWTGCLDKSSLTGDARPLFTGPKEQQEARLSKQASLTSAPWWLNSLAGQCGMSERLGARRVLESSQGVDWWRGITWGSRGRKDTIGVGRFGIYCNYRGSNPGLRLQQTRRLCHPCIGCISRGPKHDRVVFAKAPVGHSLRRESVTHWNVDATSHSFDNHVLEHKNCVRYRLPRRCDLDTNYGHDHWWPSHWRWNGKTG